MKKHFLLMPALFVLAISTVLAQNVSFDKKADFFKYKTYKWVPIPNAQAVDELTAEQLTGTLEVELAKKGLTKTQSEKADLYIGYQIAGGNGKKAHIGLAYGSGVAGSNASGAATTTTVHSGELVLDMYDSSSKQLVWRGVVSNPVDREAKPDKRQKHMDQTVQKLLKDYPPKKT
jgi:hypothetical protein